MAGTAIFYGCSANNCGGGLAASSLITAGDVMFGMCTAFGSGGGGGSVHTLCGCQGQRTSCSFVRGARSVGMSTSAAQGASPGRHVHQAW